MTQNRMFNEKCKHYFCQQSNKIKLKTYTNPWTALKQSGDGTIEKFAFCRVISEAILAFHGRFLSFSFQSVLLVTFVFFLVLLWQSSLYGHLFPENSPHSLRWGIRLYLYWPQIRSAVFDVNHSTFSCSCDMLGYVLLTHTHQELQFSLQVAAHFGTESGHQLSNGSFIGLFSLFILSPST